MELPLRHTYTADLLYDNTASTLSSVLDSVRALQLGAMLCLSSAILGHMSWPIQPAAVEYSLFVPTGVKLVDVASNFTLPRASCQLAERCSISSNDSC